MQDIAILEELRRSLRQNQTGRAMLDATLVRFALAEQFTSISELLSGGAAWRRLPGRRPLKKKKLAEPVAPYPLPEFREREPVAPPPAAFTGSGNSGCSGGC